jgi:hypothetical protein
MDGLLLEFATGNTIIQNTISNNGVIGNQYNQWGIRLGWYNHDNVFHHNNVLYNRKQVEISYKTYDTVWDDGAGEGNYWSDYTGVDDGSNGRTPGDGVGDTLIPHPDTPQGDGYYQLDNYPLMSPWSPNDPPVAEAGGPYPADEGSPITFDASGSTDPDADELQFRWDFDNDGNWDTSYSTTPTAVHTWYDDHGGIAKVEVYDGTETDIDTADVTVSNVAPTITDFDCTLDPVQLGTPVDITGYFTDPGTLDTHTATIDWGDGSDPDTDNVVDEDLGTVTDSYTYGQAGVFVITLTVEDDDSGSDSWEFLYAVIFDPAGGFVTGGGWIYSPPGAHFFDPDDPGGKANFGFVAKYKKGANEPMGNTQFEFEVGDLEFHSVTYDWLIITGSKAMFKGTGTVNEVEGYKFMISVIDGDLEEQGGEDKFRIRIWQEDNLGNENVIYDNGTETPLGGGQIMIHQGK